MSTLFLIIFLLPFSIMTLGVISLLWSVRNEKGGIISGLIDDLANRD